MLMIFKDHGRADSSARQFWVLRWKTALTNSNVVEASNFIIYSGAPDRDIARDPEEL